MHVRQQSKSKPRPERRKKKRSGANHDPVILSTRCERSNLVSLSNSSPTYSIDKGSMPWPLGEPPMVVWMY